MISLLWEHNKKVRKDEETFPNYPNFSLGRLNRFDSEMRIN